MHPLAAHTERWSVSIRPITSPRSELKAHPRTETSGGSAGGPYRCAPRRAPCRHPPTTYYHFQRGSGTRAGVRSYYKDNWLPWPGVKTTRGA